jgi:uncharacterized membrane protein
MWKEYFIKFLKWVLSIVSEQDKQGSTKRVLSFIAMGLVLVLDDYAIKHPEPAVIAFAQFCDQVLLLFILVLLGLATWNNIANNKVTPTSPEVKPTEQ